jgi:lipopolysaccharide transport system ATP-binding protein
MSAAMVVDNLSKQYQLGQLAHETMLREAVVGFFKSPLKRIRTKKETIWALRDVSFEVKKGEVVGIIGRNGAGKSTLLKLLSKITYPTHGSVRVEGRIASLLEVGTGFHEELTGRENVYLNGSILGMKKRETDARMDDIVAFADVEKFIDTPIKRYSSGMRLRLGFAVAAHLDPDVLLVDEVLAVGDVGFQKKCLNAMESMHTGGRTVLFVSHNMSAIENLCPRTIWIDEGRVRDDGPTSEIIKTYMSTFAGNQQTGSDLTEFEDRTGSGEIRCTGVEILDSDRRPNNLIRAGDSLVIRMFYKVHQQVANPHFAIEITSDMGSLITLVSTWHTGYDIPMLEPGEGYIDLEIDCLNLMPSRYQGKIIIRSVGKEPYDSLENCLPLDIETSDFYGSGRGIDRRYGLVCFPCRWKLGTEDNLVQLKERLREGN